MLLMAVTTAVCAQTENWTQARKEIHENIHLSGSNHTAYVDPIKELTPTPKGYEPFYLTHYGRHGSRWLIGNGEYNKPLEALRRAHDNNVLTERGELLLTQLEEICQYAKQRYGDLSIQGERQHHRIGKRWGERFPEIFCNPNTQIDARSTTVIRSILSMTAACEELAAANPKARIHNDVSNAFQYYLNASWSQRAKDDNSARHKDMPFSPSDKYVDPTHFWTVVFTDPAYRDTVVTSRRQLMRYVFNLCSIQQSHDSNIDLYDIFTEEECYNLWRCDNISWYLSYTQGTAPFTQSELLRNIIATADTIVNNSSYHGATLRYGHDVCVQPLASLLEMGDCNAQVKAQDIDTLDRVWANYRIIPMAGNVQLVFYRPKSGTGDILVKALLNEEETSLPGIPVSGPYYRWDDLRAYYEKKLLDYDNTL